MGNAGQALRVRSVRWCFLFHLLSLAVTAPLPFRRHASSCCRHTLLPACMSCRPLPSTLLHAKSCARLLAANTRAYLPGFGRCGRSAVPLARAHVTLGVGEGIPNPLGKCCTLCGGALASISCSGRNGEEHACTPPFILLLSPSRALSLPLPRYTRTWVQTDLATHTPHR
jgi:hypothetical protein